MIFLRYRPEVDISCLIVMLFYLLESITGSDRLPITAGNGKRRTFIIAGILPELSVIEKRRRKARIAIIRLVKYALTFSAHKAGIDSIQRRTSFVCIVNHIIPKRLTIG